MATAVAVLEGLQDLEVWVRKEHQDLDGNGQDKPMDILPWQDWAKAIQHVLGDALLKVDLATLISCERSTWDVSAAVTARIEQVLSAPAMRRILMPRPAEIRDYLLDHPDMIETVGSVCRKASSRFQNDTQLSLEVYHDPEIVDEYLTLYLRQKVYDDAILDRIEQVCGECEGELAGGSGWMLVTTDFRTPESSNP